MLRNRGQSFVKRLLAMVLCLLALPVFSCPAGAAELLSVKDAVTPLEYADWKITQERGQGPVRRRVPVLMYHHLVEAADGGESISAISAAQFEEQMAYLSREGYTAVTVDQLINFVEKGRSLPQKPVCITFDDGYLSNYQLAFPILQKYGMKATIFAIGFSVGATEFYKDTQHPIIPHFNFEQAREMVDSGLVSIQSHTYDMHQRPEYETGDKIRPHILKLENETEEEYIQALTEDFTKSKAALEEALDKPVKALAYPLGAADDRSQAILEELGVKVTFTTQSGSATLTRGDSQSLARLPRFTVTPHTTLEDLAAWAAQGVEKEN